MSRPPAGRVALLVAVLLPAVAAAKNISISIQPAVEVKDGALTARVRISNGGDEAAESVAPVLRFGEQVARAEVRPALAPNEVINATLTLPAAGLATGRWPYRLAVDYTDANQYPFQALHVGLVTVGQTPPPAKIAVAEVKAPPLAGSGTVQVRVKNLAAVERRVAVLLAVPEGLEVTKPPGDVALAAWAESTVGIPIVNRTALVGSRYPLFVAAEYDDEGVHQTVVGQGIVEIQTAQSFVQEWRTTLWVGGGILIALWLALLLWQGSVRRLRREPTAS